MWWWRRRGEERKGKERGKKGEKRKRKERGTREEGGGRDGREWENEGRGRERGRALVLDLDQSFPRGEPALRKKAGIPTIMFVILLTNAW